MKGIINTKENLNQTQCNLCKDDFGKENNFGDNFGLSFSNESEFEEPYYFLYTNDKAFKTLKVNFCPMCGRELKIIMKDEELKMKENKTANTNTSSTTTMTLDKALEICRQRVSIDRRMRENIPVEKFNDYDKFCENECIAIETLINALQCRKALDNLKEGFYNPKEHKPFVFDDARRKEIRDAKKQ